jgi:hypothetical protein
MAFDEEAFVKYFMSFVDNGRRKCLILEIRFHDSKI